MEEDVQAEVGTLLRALVHLVASRHFVTENSALLVDLEQLQRCYWENEERLHRQRHPTVRALGQPVLAAQQQAPSGRPRTKSTLVGVTASTSSQRSRRKKAADSVADADLTSLQRQFDLMISSLPHEQGSSSCGGSSVGFYGSAISCISCISGNAGSNAVYPTPPGTKSLAPRRLRGRSSHRVVTPSGSGFASCAESLLPATPTRSQFTFEVSYAAKLDRAPTVFHCLYALRRYAAA